MRISVRLMDCLSGIHDVDEGRLEDGPETLSGNFTMAYASAEDAHTAERNLKHVPSIIKIKRID